MRNEIFLDTSYTIALSFSTDDFHLKALSLANQLKVAGTRYVTTYAVMLEIGDAFSKQRHRRSAVNLLASLQADPQAKIIPVSKQLYARAYQLYSERSDKEWGLTDCVSFVVMRDRDITEALSADIHFRQAGFRALLRDETA